MVPTYTVTIVLYDNMFCFKEILEKSTGESNIASGNSALQDARKSDSSLIKSKV